MENLADFGGARKWAREIALKNLPEGGRAVDATMGNGQDTLWLAERAGNRGLVYAFDVQPDALARTEARLLEAGYQNRVRLFCAGHERMAELVPEKVDCVVFNLGWLPGAPRECTTRAETTLAALAQALALLKPGGVVTVCVYPGHPEGMREREALLAWARELDDKTYDALVCGYANIQKQPPLLIAVTKRASK